MEIKIKGRAIEHPSSKGGETHPVDNSRSVWKISGIFRAAFPIFFLLLPCKAPLLLPAPCTPAAKTANCLPRPPWWLFLQLRGIHDADFLRISFKVRLCIKFPIIKTFPKHTGALKIHRKKSHSWSPIPVITTTVWILYFLAWIWLPFYVMVILLYAGVHHPLPTPPFLWTFTRKYFLMLSLALDAVFYLLVEE